MIDLKLRPTPSAVPDARKALDALDDHVSAQTLDDLRLLVSELVTNSVRGTPASNSRRRSSSR